MKHISESTSRLRIALYNIDLWCFYALQLAVPHDHDFRSKKGARNWICWCGAVKLLERVQLEDRIAAAGDSGYSAGDEWPNLYGSRRH